MSDSVPGEETPRPKNIHEAGYETSLEEIDPATVQPSIQSFAPYMERQGLFIHTFQCMACSLEFAIFSWWPDRHTVVNTTCPECHRITQKSHWMSIVADNPKQRFGEGPEIFHYSPAGPEPRLMADSSLFTGLPEQDPWAGWPDVT
jgi:hypothetical protein